MEEKLLRKSIEPILRWYQKEKRILPWRLQKDPYKIWISEIMLQQTKIEAVKKYYERFMEQVPTVHDLANIEEETLLKLWEGLGYYARARNLKKAAQIIEHQYDGKMPNRYEELLSLPGIGQYTAGAIASIAFDEKIPAVDGNVLRVISRIVGSKKDVLLATTKKQVTEILMQIMPKQAGDFNEGLMELGEIICIPNREPLCNRCPVQKLCIAYNQNLTGSIPVREKKITRKKEKRIVLLLQCDGKIAIQKRNDKGLLANMYEFPNIEYGKQTEKIEEIVSTWGLKIKKLEKIGKHKHVFSHIEWDMTGYLVEVEKENTMFLWVDKKEIEQHYAIPTAFRFLKDKLK